VRDHQKTRLPAIKMDEVKGPNSDIAPCWKRAYDTEQEAAAAIERLFRAGPRRPYRCGYCNKWHVTKRKHTFR
jgi:hypothetical protein